MMAPVSNSLNSLGRRPLDRRRPVGLAPLTRIVTHMRHAVLIPLPACLSVSSGRSAFNIDIAKQTSDLSPQPLPGAAANAHDAAHES